MRKEDPEEVKGFISPSSANEQSTTTSSITAATTTSSSSSSSSTQVTWLNFLCRSRHPSAAIAHVGFKAAAILLYVFSGWSIFGLSYSTVFISVTLLLAADFWTVKNVTGRLLVGLRWWNKIREDGSSEWVFESAPEGSPQSELDKRIFWSSLYAAPAAFALMLFLHVFSLSLEWAIVDVVSLGLLGPNLIGYYRCSSDAQKRLRATLTAGVMGALQGGTQGQVGGGGVGGGMLDLFARAAAAASIGGNSLQSGSSLSNNGNINTTSGGGGGGGGGGNNASTLNGNSLASNGSGGGGGGGGNSGSISDLEAVMDPFGLSTSSSTSASGGSFRMANHRFTGATGSETVPI